MKCPTTSETIYLNMQVKFAGPRIDGLSWDQHGLELVSTLTPWELVRGTPLFKATKGYSLILPLPQILLNVTSAIPHKYVKK
jgi:hypothetical protein